MKPVATHAKRQHSNDSCFVALTVSNCRVVALMTLNLLTALVFQPPDRQEDRAVMPMINRKHAVHLCRETWGVGSISWLQRLAAEGKGPPVYMLNGRSALYEPSEIIAWGEANLRPITPVNGSGPLARGSETAASCAELPEQLPVTEAITPKLVPPDHRPASLPDQHMIAQGLAVARMLT